MKDKNIVLNYVTLQLTGIMLMKFVINVHKTISNQIITTWKALSAQYKNDIELLAICLFQLTIYEGNAMKQTFYQSFKSCCYMLYFN